MATQADIDAILRDAGVSGQSQGVASGQAAPRQQHSLGPFGLGTIPKQMPVQQPTLQATPTREQITADVVTGAPLLDRLAGAFKFDPQGVENYLKEEYGQKNVFRGTDGNLFFLPPDQLALPETDRTFVRFNPEGLDVGDVIEFVPAAIGMAGGVAAAALSGGASVPVTLAALAGGGAAAEAATQAVGALLPGEEPTATPLSRAGRVAASGALELAGGAVGEVAQRTIPTILRQADDAARRGVQKLVRKGVDPEQIAARERLGIRVGQDFTEAQLSQSNAALLAERALRQFIGTTDVAGKVDLRQLERLGENAFEQIQRLSAEGAEGGAEAAIDSFAKYVDSLVSARSKAASPLFQKARSAAGNERIIPLTKTEQVIDELIEDYSSDLSSSQSERVVEFLRKRKEGLPSEGTSISRMQNMLRDWGKDAAKGRNVIAEVKDPVLERRIAAKMFGALQDDLENASNMLLRRDSLGRFKSAADVREAASALQEARALFREMSEPLNQLVENPLGEFVGKPDKLIKEFINSGRDTTKAVSVMQFLDSTAPAEANRLRATVIDEMLRGARRGAADELVSPARLVSIANKSQRRLSALFAGNTEAKAAFSDMIESARILSNQARLQGSQTAPIQLVNKLAQLVAAPALAGSVFLGGGNLSDAQEETALIAATLLGSRWLARSMFHPPAAKAYSKVFTAATKPKLSAGAKKAVRQAIIDIAGFNKRMDETERGTRTARTEVEVAQ